jgi:hypothetical protein
VDAFYMEANMANSAFNPLLGHRDAIRIESLLQEYAKETYIVDLSETFH